MNELVEFLRARFDEDERVARAAGNRRWLVQDNIIELHPEREDDGFMSWPTRADARHAATWEPARVLREIESKRRILGEVVPAVIELDGIAYSEGQGSMAYGEPPLLLLKLLSLSYADHPDYRPEWRP